MGIYQKHGKRWVDVLVSAPALLVALPLLLTIGVAVLCSMGRPILFRQRRTGLHGRTFDLLKFRTMTDSRDASGVPLPDDCRITRVGRFLRAFSLDELPQLWNVMCGEMSLVGPRPLLESYLRLYSPRQAKRHEAMPGITGWAQVQGRNLISWENRFLCDVYYVEHVSAWLDLQILLKTTWMVIVRSGISADSHCTMPRFTGTGTSENDHADAA
jgi:sugar transferase EpsL